MQPPHQPPPWDPSQYNQPTQGWNAQPPPPYVPSPAPVPANPPRKPRRKFWRIVAIVVGILVLACAGCSIAVAMTPTQKNPSTTANIGSSVTATKPVTQAATNTTATATLAPAVVLSPTLNPTPTMQPTQQPTPSPTLAPTQPPATPTPTPVPPQVPKPTPTPTPACVAVNNNPWCYNFNTLGNLISTPPSGFCNYFACISSFYGANDPGDGYIVECNDSTYSQSGGESGACSYHGGVMRPLYSH